MIKTAGLLAVFLLVCPVPLLAQKKAPPHAQGNGPQKAIRFQGAAQYSQDELLAAAGIKPGARLTAADVKLHAKQLNDTGFFAVVKFGNDSKGLLFTLTPASQLYPMHLGNLPFTPGKDLDDKLHARFPLYRGLLPASGSTDDGICRAFEEMLAGEGFKATVKAALTSGLGPQKVTAVDFSVVSPPVRIGAIHLAGVSPTMQARVNTLIDGQIGNEFDTENTALGLERIIEDLYQDQGYAAAAVDVSRIDPSSQESNEAIEIPFFVTVTEGGIYKLGAITYPNDALVSRADVQKILARFQAGSGRPLDQFLFAVNNAYRARGYIDCIVVPHASFSEATHVVNYSIEIDPGPLYRMGGVHFDGAPDAMSARLAHIWKMAPGDTFDESYVVGFAARTEKQDRILSKWMQTVVVTFDVRPDADTHQVNCVFHFVKAAQGGR